MEIESWDPEPGGGIEMVVVLNLLDALWSNLFQVEVWLFWWLVDVVLLLLIILKHIPIPIAAGLMVMTVSWHTTRHLSWACSHLCSWSFRQGWTQVTQMGLFQSTETLPSDSRDHPLLLQNKSSETSVHWTITSQPRGLWTTWSAWYKPSLKIHLAAVKSQVAPLQNFFKHFCESGSHGIIWFHA